jgi:hypothetical protein
LLWYKGKLIKPNVLLTTAGDTVLYNPKQRQVKVVSKSGTGNQFDKMLAEVNNTGKRIDITVKRVTQMLPRHLQTSFGEAIEKAYTSVEEEWGPLLSNSMVLPEGDPVFSSPVSNASTKGGPHNFMEDENVTEENRYQEILQKFRAFREKHTNDNLGSLPVPPRSNFSYCAPCDSIGNARYDKEVKYFLAEVTAVDRDIMDQAIQFSAYMQRGSGIGLFDEAANDETWNFIQFLLGRGAKRAALLVEKYKNDAERIPAVLSYLLPVHRQLQLMGEESNPTALTGLEYYEPIYATMHKYFSNAMKEKDYTVGLNIHFILKMERERQILGRYIPGDENLMEQFLTFNQFKLHSNITVKLGQSGGYIAGHVRGDNWFYALPDQKTCRLNWILASDKPERTAKYKLLVAELGGAPVEYVGTKDWQSQPPIFKMDFCYPEGKRIPDTILAHNFHPEGFREQWRYPDPTGVIEVEQVSGALMVCFMDVKEAKKQAEALSKEMMDKKTKEFKEKAAKLGAGNVNAQMDMALKLQSELEKINKDIQETVLKANPLKYTFTPQVNNKTTAILKERLDGREIFPENGAIIYAWFHLTMDHDPEGPHRIPSILKLVQ